MKTIVFLIALCFSQTALADGPMYFVGTTAELYEIRAAALHGEHLQSLAHGLTGFDARGWASPHTEEATDGRGLAPPLGFGEVDCMRAYVESPNWNDGTYQYLGNCYEVDGQSVCVPAYSELVSESELPSVCAQYLFDLTCGPSGPGRDELCEINLMLECCE